MALTVRQRHSHLYRGSRRGGTAHRFAVCGIPAIDAPLPTKSSLRASSLAFCIPTAGLVLFLTGVNVGFLPVGHYLGTLARRREIPVAAHSHRHAHGIFLSGSGTCRTRAQARSRGIFQRRNLAARAAEKPIHRRCGGGRRIHAARAHGHLPVLFSRARLCGGAHAFFLRAACVYRHRVRRGRRGDRAP